MKVICVPAAFFSVALGSSAGPLTDLSVVAKTSFATSLNSEGCACCLECGDSLYHVPPKLNSTSDPCFKETADPPWGPPPFMTDDCFFTSAAEGNPPELQKMLNCFTPDRGAHNDSRALLLIGDSHAQMMMPALKRALGGTGIANASLTVGSMCTYVQWNSGWCKTYNDGVAQAVNQTVRPGDVVMVGVLWHYLPEDKLPLQEEYLKALHSSVRARGGSLVVSGDTQYLPKRLGNVTQEDFFSSYKPVGDMYTRLAQLEGLYYFDQHELLCDGTDCGSKIPGTSTLAIWDVSHWTEAASEYMGLFLCPFLFENGPFALDEVFEIRNTNSQKCLDIAGGSESDHANIQLFTCHLSPGQKWQWYGSSLQNPQSGKCLDIKGGSVSDQASIQLFQCSGSANQQWEKYASDQKDFQLRNPVSGKCIDIQNDGTADHDRVQLFTCKSPKDTAANQYFQQVSASLVSAIDNSLIVV